MAIATGVYKQVAIKAESAYGVAPGAAAAQLLRRVESSVDLTKDTYESNEKAPHLQVVDFRHGTRRVSGRLGGEMSPRTYTDIFGVAMKRVFTALPALTAMSVTVAGAGPTYTITRAAGDFLVGGIKVGHVVRLTAGALNAANLNKNLFVTDVTATVLTVVTLNGSALVAEGPVTGTTLTLPGKQSWVPFSGHVEQSFAIEHFYPEVPSSELFLGCKASKIDVGLPATGMSTFSADILGQNVTPGSAQYFTAPTAPTSTGVLAAVNGLLRVAGQRVGSVTGLNISMSMGYTGDPVVGSNFIPELFPGRVRITGQFTAYFDSPTLRDAFINETEIDIISVLTAGNEAAADFITFVMPRVKVGSASKDDPEGGIVGTYSYQALLRANGGAGQKHEQTTLLMQDSAA